jgi:hypothetical protein
VDDDPARVSQWLPALAALGAKPPRRIPAWIAHFVIGDAVVFMTDVRALNAKAGKPSLEFDLAELAGWIQEVSAIRRKPGFTASKRHPASLACVIPRPMDCGTA